MRTKLEADEAEAKGGPGGNVRLAEGGPAACAGIQSGIRLLAAAFFLAVLLAPARAYAADTTSGDWGDCTWEVAGDTQTGKTLTVQGTENAPQKSAVGLVRQSPWNSRTGIMQDVKTIVMGTAEHPVKITGENGEKLFGDDDCREVKTIDMTYADTADVTDMHGMFYRCQALTEIKGLDKMDTGKSTDMAYMFYDCKKLVNADVSNFNTKNVKNMLLMFADCTSLGSLDLSSFNMENVGREALQPTGVTGNISGMFSGCESLTQITGLDRAELNTSNIADMSELFADCKKLGKLDVSGLNTESVGTKDGFLNTAGSMASMFAGCESLTELAGINGDNFDTSRVKNMSAMFLGCKKLTSLDVSKFNTASAEYMPSMFYGCESLTDLRGLKGANFDTSKVKSMSYMFAMCKKLTSLDLSGLKTGQVSSAAGMFYGCELLSSVDVDLSFLKGLEVYNASQVFFDCPSLKEVPGSLMMSQELIDKSQQLRMFDFSSASSDPVRTRYAGKDTYTIRYPWGAECRALDITSLDEGRASVKLQAGGADISGEVSAGTKLSYVLAPEELNRANAEGALDTLAVSWERKRPGETDFTPVPGMNGADYTVGADDIGAQIRVKVSGSGDLCGELTAASPASVDSTKAEPQIECFDITLPGTAPGYTQTYDGNAVSAGAAPKSGVNGMGEITLWYEKKLEDGSFGNPSKEAPRDAGDYRALLSVAEGDMYQATNGLLTAGTFTIAPRPLEHTPGPLTANLAPVRVNSQGSVTDTDVRVALAGGNLVAGDAVSVTGCEVLYPSVGSTGEKSDAKVTIQESCVLSNANYALPVGGLILENQTYEVTAATLAGISITRQPDKTSYLAGEAFVPDGMQVTASYDDGTKKEVTAWIDWTPKGGLQASDAKVTVSYRESGVEQTADAAVEVEALTYTIQAASALLDFGTELEGYAQPAAQTVSVTNTGNQAVQLRAPSGSSYECSLSNKSLASGESAELAVRPKEGLVEGTYEETLSISTDQGTSADVAAAFSVKKNEPWAYPVISVGADNSGVWTKGAGGFEVRIDGDYALFEHRVEVDNTQIAEGTQYISRRGSTVVELSEDYLNTLAVGWHTMRAWFVDGYAEARFEIRGSASGEKPGGAPSGFGPDGSGAVRAANTGDQQPLGSLLGLMALAGAVSAVRIIRGKR